LTSGGVRVSCGAFSKFLEHRTFRRTTMPNIKSAIKRVKTAEKSRQRNVAAKSELKTLRKNLLASAKDAAKGPEAYANYCSALDKSVKRGIIPKNRAIRKKGRAAALLRKQAAAE